jgi:hypothetical protein
MHRAKSTEVSKIYKVETMEHPEIDEQRRREERKNGEGTKQATVAHGGQLSIK